MDQGEMPGSEAYLFPQFPHRGLRVGLTVVDMTGGRRPPVRWPSTLDQQQTVGPLDEDPDAGVIARHHYRHDALPIRTPVRA
jgi:hypothetical protein